MKIEITWDIPRMFSYARFSLIYDLFLIGNDSMRMTNSSVFAIWAFPLFFIIVERIGETKYIKFSGATANHHLHPHNWQQFILD